MLFKRSLSLFYFASMVIVFGQSTEADRLLTQAESIVLYNPSEAYRISKHVYKSSESNTQKVTSLYINALSNYVMGQYDDALTSAFLAKNSSNSQNDYTIKSEELILHILSNLSIVTPNSVEVYHHVKNEPLISENLLIEADSALVKNQLNVVDDIEQQLLEKQILNMESLGFLESKYLELKGDRYFQAQQLDSAKETYKQSLVIAQKIENPFLKREIYQKLATNYLALDSLSKFQEANQQALNLEIETEKIQSDTTNTAHELVSKDLDNKLIKTSQLYKTILGVLLLLLLIGIVFKVAFFIRNKNKLKMYNSMLKYLAEQEQTETDKAKQEETKQPTTQKTTILKESEKQILQALEKFESTKKYTNKDMSLSLLASQLNTNTKYLSEVINRYKQKNFNAYINELRINYITEKIKTESNYLNYKVSYLAEESGFSSHSTFTTVFKSIVGVSPIMFVEFVKAETKKESLKVSQHV